MKYQSIKSALKLAAIYAVLGGLWILLSDNLLIALVADPETQASYQTYKGWFYVLVSAVLIFWLGWRALRVQAGLIDKLQRNEERLSAIFNGVNDAILLFDLQTQKIVDANTRTRWMFGCHPEGLRQLGISDLSQDQPPDNLELARRNLGMARQGQERHFDWHVRRPDGASFWAEVTVRQTQVNGRATALMVVRDVSDRRLARERLKQAAAVFDSTNDGLVLSSDDQVVIAANRAFREISGLSEQDLQGRTVPLPGNDGASVELKGEIAAGLAAHGRWDREVDLKTADGTLCPFQIGVKRIGGRDGGGGELIWVFTDVSELKATQQRLEHLAYFDRLTRLPNRLLIHERIKAAILAADQEKGQQVAALYIDLDNFKDVNDSLGHPVGDDLLIAVAERLKTRLTPTDSLAHLGGDEFLLLMPGIKDKSEAAETATAILDSMREPFRLTSESQVYLGASIGVCLYPEHASNTTELVQFADAAMYQAKKTGRSTWRFFSSNLVERASRRIRYDAKLRLALENNEFELDYQPIVSGQTGHKLVGAEALLRWRPPGQEAVSPMEFISVAEDSGLIVPLGRWVLHEACRQAAIWAGQGSSVPVSVNLSAAQLQDGALPATVAEALSVNQLDASLLNLELTESMLMEQGERSAGLLQELRALGVSLTLDDFGTGYSSLSYLRQFDLDGLKIDRSFIGELDQRESDRELVSAIIGLARCFHLRVIAEGVETRAQLNILTELGCERFQGFYFSKPVGPEQLNEWF